MVSLRPILSILLLVGLLTGCMSLLPPSISTALPTEFLPTAAALTLAAEAVNLPSTSTSADPLPSDTPPPTATIAPTEPAPTQTSLPPSKTPANSPTNTLSPASAQPAETAEIQPEPSQGSPIPGEPTWTPAPPIPEARIQILRMGDLSKVISPIDVSSWLTCGDGKVVRIELYGEDGRLLSRHVRTYDNVPWKNARLAVPFEFEIAAAAELGRLVISVEDSYGRLIEVNSLNIILLSQGMTELNPPTALQQQIIIQEPQEKALIQNGRLIVSGRARPASDQPLRVMLVGEDGRILGQRLAGVPVPIPGDYGTYVAEVPYEIKEVTPALLVVFEEGAPISEKTYLTSINVILAP